MRPLVGVICDLEEKDGASSHRAGEEYVRAIRGGAGALPLLIPVTEPPPAPGDILGRVDGLLFTGAPSNVAPAQYGGPNEAGMALDTARDATSLTLIKAAIEAGVPTLCICRGFQELNVALGGTLDPHVNETAGRLDHREDEKTPLNVQYGPAHKVRIAPGGVLSRLLGAAEVTVNSLHGQGIAELAPGLFAEAHAPDELIEAVSLPGAKGFLLGVQWHPEWAYMDERARSDPVSQAIFGAFGAALRR
jgi:putative glutamine amidotransferase